ncbi:phosphate signaling complex protein PhoU [Pseudomaricurvus alkylphenolicus]|jgi:phosphate transport system protein|uniref:phosphate signaling complex protein PhoU n=1 Tax=Pseudomaricurvus alkylphenolicus TaxID=1306991 RepID=UPI0014213A9A|nr:phosphate signaling complex protein PhoU [Pseudomaricurvus alkylphenolicus]NIB39462.1 phosphate signaling complex protein PhoU [Pseudomaricurvus alkylphenolicus]
MDKLNLDQHISQQFNADLEELKTQLLEMGGVVEQQTINAVKAITTADGELAEQVIVVEEEVDEREMKLDEACTTVLARRQPAASDLRMVLAVAKITRDLERMGDEAQKIAKMSIHLNEDGEAPRGYVELRHIGSIVHQMVITTLDAFARFDVDTAVKVAQEDKRVDQEYKTAMRELATYMMEDPRSISRVMNIIWALRSLERIGDHARNIAEHVIYLVKGLDVRHISVKEMKRQLKDK